MESDCPWYDGNSMEKKTWPLKFLVFAAMMFVASLALPLLAADEPQIIPLEQIKPGMKGVMYTILAGDKVESIELEVLGILPNTLGPKQDIILVVLRGQLADFNGVVAGMSGSPVYIEGKLAGALRTRSAPKEFHHRIRRPHPRPQLKLLCRKKWCSARARPSPAAI
ncbi:MAG: hypothetical protein M1451_03905 [Acidobacteria bacterium]|nr:hypothetical protein [Acidobacteriota bacterium]